MIDEIPIELEEEIKIQVVPSILTHTSNVSIVQQMIIDQKISPILSPFFIDDSGLSKLDLSDRRFKSKPHDVKFRIKWFVYYVFLHLIFRQLGILLAPIFLLKTNGIIMLRNFGIIGHQLLTYYNNTIILLNALIIVLFSQIELDFLQYQLIISYSIIVISEAVVVAIKLAFYHPLKLELFETIPIEKINNSLEVTINPTLWVNQKSELIKEEIQQSIKRSNIEPGQFIFYFMVQPNEKRRLKIQHQFEKKLTEEDKYAGNGAKMAEEIIIYFNKKSSVKLYLAIAVLFIVCKLGIVFYYCNFFASVEQTVLFVIILIFQTKFYSASIAAMLFTFRDLQRKVFAMNQLSHLISAQQVELYDETKLFPTLNFLCIQSLFSWSNLRKILLDYGLQYSQRQTYLISYLLIVILATAAQGIYIYINPNQFDIEQIYRYMMVIHYDVCSILLLSIMIVLQGARINNHFLIHKGMLRKNLFIYEQLTSQVFLDQKHQFEPTDFVFKTLKNTLKKAQMGEIEFINYSQFLINAIETVYQDLAYDEQYQPFTVLGVAMTNKLLFQLIFSFLGILGTVLANIYLNMNL